MARILTIEDDSTIRTLLVAQLTARGHDMLEAAAGDVGFALAREERPDVVLLDLGLPGMHGTAVLDALKADPYTSAIPVIVVSAWGEGHVAAMARGRGAAGVLRKPYEAQQLFDLVDAALAPQ